MRYFADAREAASTDQEEVELADDACVRDALAALVARHPALGDVATRSRVAVDEAFATPDQPLAAGATLALIPPVGGG